MLKEQKEHPDTLCIPTDPVHKRVPPQSEAPREERVQTKRRLTINRRERQPKERCQTCVKHEREHEGSTTHKDRSILAHMSESR